jgi:hypothetical protein
LTRSLLQRKGDAMDSQRTPEQLVASLVKLLEPTSNGDDHFTGRKKRGGLPGCVAHLRLPL